MWLAGALLWLLVVVVRALGRARYALAALIGSAWFRGAGSQARARAAANHRRLNPRLRPGAADRLARASYREYVAMILDCIWAEPLSAAGVRGTMRFRGLNHLAEGDQGAVVAVSHFGNWDMAASGAMALGRQVSTVMAPIGPSLLTEIVVSSRVRKGLELFTPQQAARGLARALRVGRLVALMIDVPEAGPTVAAPFCGGTVRLSAVPVRLAAATRVPIIPAACWREGRGWILEFYPPVRPGGAPEAEVLAQIAATLEPEIRRHPEQWYPFHEVYVDEPAA